ncbi:E3 ubiquitin-protein ligase listerin [Cytospora mali]|uniref:E3 ubiquitin-protein ligase listerin n=1 Tax=Cytospora mali TaxID=578113 RepID=A0A194VXW4_CYTMA|nr:E3 ubiquitin-protein ligase listerin [Valsa mali]
MVSKKSAMKGRAVSGRGFGSPAPSAFGGFSTPSASTGSLSYLSEDPDFSLISDSNIVVSFKNLLKKDNTTKSKALADLVQYTQAHPNDQDGGVEEAVLETWVRLYPRISIDNDRRVRELSHTLQFELLKSARKRMERNIPKVAGAWLAGTFDKDKAVAKAATEGFSVFLTTEEKVANFWRKCQPQVLQYATDAVMETPDTLSDERSTKPEDAEAKYYRVIAASFSLVLGLLQRLSSADTEKYNTEYETFFASGPGDCVWSFATADDSYVRKMVYQLLQLCMEKRSELIQPQLFQIGKILTSDALKKSQMGSAVDFVTVLTNLTLQDSQIWGTKKPPIARLRGFVEKGSQGGPPSFWQNLDKLLAAVPPETMSSELASQFFKSFRSGISRRDEPRSNAPYAWMTYLNAVSRLLPRLDADSRIHIITENVFPLTETYLFSTERQGEWLVGGNVVVLSRAYKVAALSEDAQITHALATEWERLADILVARLSNSLPEVSKEFEVSQNKLAEDGKRWFSITGAVHAALNATASQPDGNESSDYTESASHKVIQGAAGLLKRRNYKPFGAAAILLSALKQTPHLFGSSEEHLLASLIPTGSDEEMTKLLSSPSAPYILSCLMALGHHNLDQWRLLWTNTIRCLLKIDDESTADTYITKLISDTAAKTLAQDNDGLKEYAVSRMLASARNENPSWELFAAALEWDTLSRASLQEVSSQVVDALNSENESSIKAVEIILRQKPALFSEDEALHLALVTKLLSMMEIDDTSISARASRLRSLLENHVDAQPSLMSIIQENLDQPGPNSLGVETLVQQTVAMSKTGDVDLEQLFPNTNVWMREILPMLESELSPALTLTSSIGGAYFLPQATKGKTVRTQRDQRGLSVPARMAMYTVALFDSGIGPDSLPQRFQAELLYLLYLAAELASDQITLMDGNKLFSNINDSDLLTEVEGFVSSTRRVINKLFVESGQWRPGQGESGLVDEFVDIMIQHAKNLTPIGLYSARALSEIFTAFSDAHGYGTAVEEWIGTLDVMKATPSTVFPAVALLTGYGEALSISKAASTLLNRLISDIAGANPQSEKTILSLVLLNACTPVFELGQLPVANNRLVFAVKQITSWFDQPIDSLGSAVSTESCRALQRLLPCVSEVYGPYWEQTIEFCLSLWAHAAKDKPEQRLPYIHASVKLLTGLKAISDPNDDLVDALESHAESIYHGLLELLKIPTDSTSQPQEIVDALLCREAEKIPLEHLKDLSDVYGLVASESRGIQTAGFDLLHRALPVVQEELSVDVLIEKKQAKLPDELMSLLLDAPTLDAYPEEILVQFPAPIRSYLLSWKLIFDAYEGAAYKIRGDYTEQLKTSDAIGPLMDFTFDVLGHSAASPVNIDKTGLTNEDIQDYDVKVGDGLPDEKNMQWLLIHIFYLTLKYVPGLFKAWFIDCRSKQTRIAVEPWMTKWFAPIIIHDAIEEVEKWSKSQEVSDPEENELVVKINYKQREITASYPIDDGGDEQSATLLLQINANFPLGNVNVTGLNRVGCSERTWMSWCRITQGIITISNGSIIDGLSAFRRNVVGALKGHVECAICYSFIAVDKKMPDKRCGTCKNLFHRDCLFKWFNSANQNTCPLCRTRMDFVDKKKTWRN